MARRLQVYRGIHPIVSAKTEQGEAAVEEAMVMGFLNSGEEVVVVSVDDTSLGRTATVKIAVVP